MSTDKTQLQLLASSPPNKNRPSALPPMMLQYQQVKREYPEHALLFQVGDFYEIFFDDAPPVAEALELRLTSRDKNAAEPIPMCGFPVHALESYLPRLLKQGFSCVVMSQVEGSVDTKKGGVRREISRIVTPGIRYEGDGLDEVQFNFLAALLLSARGAGALAYADVSTGHLRIVEVDSEDELRESLQRISPVEVLVPRSVGGVPLRGSRAQWTRGVRDALAHAETHVVEYAFDALSSTELATRLARFSAGERQTGVPDGLSPEARAALAALLSYIEDVSVGRLPCFDQCTLEDSQSAAVIDATTWRNLEIFETAYGGGKAHSLYAHLNQTKTPMGARLLGDWLRQPLIDVAAIQARLDAVEELAGNQGTVEAFRETLSAIRDLDRLVSRITSMRMTPRDAATLRDSLQLFPRIKETLVSCSASFLKGIDDRFDVLSDVATRLSELLVAEPPLRANEGGIVREGYDAELDRLRDLALNGKQWLAGYEQQEREALGIPTLKVKYNNVFGYFVEVSKAQAQKVPESYERKQTLVNAERYSTPALKEMEQEILSARDTQYALEREIFEKLRDELLTHIGRLQLSARLLATLDASVSLAWIAHSRNLVRPEVSDGVATSIVGGRHFVIEQLIGEQNFVPNDIALDGTGERFAVLTGPNMGGKSTFLRQIGIIQLLAQIGSFVPATSADVGVVDRIFTRIGAGDDITRGDSTFMVEMRETAQILRRSTERSLVLIDEIGRGTATTDGLALAQAIATWLNDRISCRTIFATHFHELTGMTERHPGMFCISVGVEERERDIIFTHRIEPGACPRSYGLEVATLAGLPAELVDDARAFMQAPASTSVADAAAGAAPGPRIPVDPVALELRRAFDEIEPMAMTPLDALHRLFELKALLGQETDTTASARK